MEKKIFIQAENCLYPGRCKNAGACLVASSIKHEAETKSAGRPDDLKTAVDENKYPCSHEQAVKAREEHIEGK